VPPPVTPYSWLTFAQAKQTLLQDRLNSTGTDYWLNVEAGLYIQEALRTWNALTQTFVADFTATYTNTDKVWQSLANSSNTLLGSNPSNPRFQTLNDAYIYTLAQYHLLEPPSGAVWTGTPQFTITDFAQALQRRRDLILQLTACNVGPFSATFGLPAGQSRVYLPDSASQSILDIRRMRFLPLGGSPSTLYREDGLAFEYFENDFTTAGQGTPFAWDVLAGPPLALTFDASPALPNTLDMLTMISGGLITPPTASPLLIPDDWFWVLKWGMMSDLLRKESEATDLERADYCEMRFREGVQLMMELPWLLQARIDNQPVDTPSVTELDQSADGYEWQSNPNAWPAIVRGGIDLFAICPTIPTTIPATNIAVTLSLVGNQPVPAADGDFIQVSRDVFDSILDYAEHLAQFKMGGFEFAESTRTLYKSFIATASQTNSRLRESGIFQTTLRPPNSRQEAADPRFAETSVGG
jgi:hypothetical protein